MTVFALGEIAPRLDSSVYVAHNATVVGNIRIGANSSVWFGATLRGDNEVISIGDGSNVQDGAVLHTDPGFPMMIGNNVSIGHQAMMHGCTVGDGSLIGIQSVILNGAVIGKECLIGAGAIITERKSFADGCLIFGAPAKVVRQLTPQERDKLRDIAENYAERAVHYRAHLKPL
jgi:carbonic anhydrase/acetyltransferase-like protein (isoleucine patch superfamily)